MEGKVREKESKTTRARERGREGKGEKDLVMC